MKLPEAILAKTLARFDSLIADGRNILAKAQNVASTNDHGISGDTCGGCKMLNAEKFSEWRTKATSLLSLVIPHNHIHWKRVLDIAELQGSHEELVAATSFLRGIKSDLEKGFLGDIAAAIEAEIACDYMGQAKQLLTEGELSHVPAAVLGGVILEKSLRTLCRRQEHPICLKTHAGAHKTLKPLIDDLKKAGVFNEVKVKQLYAWAEIRNLAAHGETDKFTRADVELMLAGINCFLADCNK